MRFINCAGYDLDEANVEKYLCFEIKSDVLIGLVFEFVFENEVLRHFLEYKHLGVLLVRTKIIFTPESTHVCLL